VEGITPHPNEARITKIISLCSSIFKFVLLVQLLFKEEILSFSNATNFAASIILVS
jgi:hypothetical protein